MLLLGFAFFVVIFVDLPCWPQDQHLAADGLELMILLLALLWCLRTFCLGRITLSKELHPQPDLFFLSIQSLFLTHDSQTASSWSKFKTGQSVALTALSISLVGLSLAHQCESNLCKVLYDATMSLSHPMVATHNTYESTMSNVWLQ